MSLFATDGPGGSGVATTEWRLDGGAWHEGTSAVIPAPNDTRRTRVLDYRSTDRAGNVEATRQLSVVVDTTRRAADARPPGVPLPPSPVTGGLDVRRDRTDLYRLRLNKGESIRLSADGPAAGIIAVELVAAPPRSAVFVGVWFPSEQASLSCVAPRDGAYYLAVYYMDWWGGAPQHYRFSYEIVPAGTDVVPPEVRIKGYRPQWRNQPLTAEVQADDGIGGSGVARIETSRDDGLTWTEGASVVVDAPADHSNDGHHFIRFRAVDAAGNVSPYELRDVRIDTQGPSTQAWGPERAVRRGSRATIRVPRRGPRAVGARLPAPGPLGRDGPARLPQASWEPAHGRHHLVGPGVPLPDARHLQLAGRSVHREDRRHHERPGRQSLGDGDLRAAAGREVRRARRRRARPSAQASLWYLNETLTLAR